MTDNKWNVKNRCVVILWSVIKQVLQKKPNHHTVIKFLSDFIREWKLDHGSKLVTSNCCEVQIT